MSKHKQAVQKVKEKYPERIVTYRGEEMLEIRAMRLQNGVKTDELSKELGIGTGLYSVHELCTRSYKPERYEQFYYDVSNAIARIKQRKEEESEQYQLSRGFEVLTDDLFSKVMAMIGNGRTIYYASIHYGVDYEEVEKRYNTMARTGTTAEDFKKVLTRVARGHSLRSTAIFYGLNYEEVEQQYKAYLDGLEESDRAVYADSMEYDGYMEGNFA